MNFFERTFLDWKVILDPKAARKPVQLNVISEVDANATPAIIGSKEKTTGTDGVWPRKIDDKMTLKRGSAALTVCVKEGATALRDTLVSTLPKT